LDGDGRHDRHEERLLREHQSTVGLVAQAPDAIDSYRREREPRRSERHDPNHGQWPDSTKGDGLVRPAWRQGQRDNHPGPGQAERGV
jgi:hypothetical protein